MRIYLLGATGSIGLQTLDIVRSSGGKFVVETVAVNRSIDKVKEIIAEFHPKFVSVGLKADCDLLKSEFPGVLFGYGTDGLIEAATFGEKGDDLVVNSIVGSAGLIPTYHAIIKGRNVALANKETLVIGGELIKPMLEKYDVTLLPIDSEHSAIMQCLKNEEMKTVESIVITASGGSFRDKTRVELKDVTVQDALKHPNWSMGAKITIDSATMMNKGLEVIEAHHLFDVPYDKIRTVLHVESIIHSLVEYNDTSMLAHLGNPDMRVPISYAINYPKRVPFKGKRLQLEELGSLHFSELSFERFPMLEYAYYVGRKGGLLPTVLNASNEAAVSLFLSGKITFLQIEDIVLECIKKYEKLERELTLASIIELDNEVKELVYKTYS